MSTSPGPAPLVPQQPNHDRAFERLLSDVSWGWLHALAGLGMAVAPVLLLVLLPLLLADGSREAAAPTVATAAVTVAVTVVLDSWYLFAAWTFSLRSGRAGLRAWGFRRPSRRIVWAVPVALVGVYGLSIVYNIFVDTKDQGILQSFPRSAGGISMFIVLACVVAPFFEETFFRGFLFQGFSRSWGLIAGATLSAGIFSLTHQQLDILVPLFVLGLALAWVFVITRSVWGSIALHSIYNGVAVIVWALGG